MATNSNGKHTNGRPPIIIDWKQFEAYCAVQCTLREIADYYDCSTKTIERKVQEHYGCPFVDIFKRKRQKGLMSLRANLFKLSEKQGNVAIFLAKNWLGMVDKQEVTGAGGGAIKTETTINVISDNAKKLTQSILNGKGTE